MGSGFSPSAAAAATGNVAFSFGVAAPLDSCSSGLMPEAKEEKLRPPPPGPPPLLLLLFLSFLLLMAAPTAEAAEGDVAEGCLLLGECVEATDAGEAAAWLAPLQFLILAGDLSRDAASVLTVRWSKRLSAVSGFLPSPCEELDLLLPPLPLDRFFFRSPGRG